MDCVGLPEVYVEMVKELDGSGTDYMTLLECKGNQWRVEGYIANIQPSKKAELEQRIARLGLAFDFTAAKQGEGIVIYKKNK